MYLDDFVCRASSSIMGYEEPLAYLRGRGLSDEDIKKFSLGYSKLVKIKKVNDKDYKELHERTYKFKGLENRIIIPLRNLVGKVNGIVSRSISEKRYIVYLMEEAKKIGAFFGLHEALPFILKSGKVFVHEAAFNSISFSKIFPNSVSTITSYINEEQYETLTMLANKIVLVFDEDEVGRKSTEILFKKYGNKFLEEVSIGYKDSNDCLRIMGLDGFGKYLKRRIPRLLQS